MKNHLRLLAALAFVSLSVACTDAAKAPAEAAMKAAETAVSGLGADVAKYAPAQVKAAQDAFAAAKEKIAKEDYKGALAMATEIPAQAKAALAAAAAKKDELVKAFTEASSSLPAMITAIKGRLDILAQAKKLPAGIDKAGLEKAKEGLAAVEKAAGSLGDQVKSGAIAEATAQAGVLKAKGQELMKAIGMAQ
jgi:hypothetical protein